MHRSRKWKPPYHFGTGQRRPSRPKYTAAGKHNAGRAVGSITAKEAHHAGKRQPSVPISRHPVRYDQARCPDGRRRHGCAGRDIQAQCAVPARCRARDLLRLHGCARGQPVSAGSDLSQGRAGQGRLCRPSAGSASARGRRRYGCREVQNKSAGSVDAITRAVEHHQEVRRAREADRRRDGVPADGRRQGAAQASCPAARSRTRCSCWSGCAR